MYIKEHFIFCHFLLLKKQIEVMKEKSDVYLVKFGVRICRWLGNRSTLAELAE